MRETNKESVKALARTILPDWQYSFVTDALDKFSIEKIKTSINYDCIMTKPFVELLELEKISPELITLLKDICDKDTHCIISTIINFRAISTKR